MNKYGGFDHNIQTLRIVTLLENKYYNFLGLNLTIETLDGLIKHNGPPKNLPFINKILKLDIFKNKINFKLNTSLEAQISSISDDIAYNNHDLEDGLRAGLFTINQLNEVPFISKFIAKELKKKNKFRREVVVNQIVRKLINEMVKDVIKTTKRNIKNKKIKSFKDVYKLNNPIVEFSTMMKKVDIEIKEFLKLNMYNHKKVIVNTNKCKGIIGDLFKYIVKKPKKFIDKYSLSKTTKERAVADFIAGMTDRYAINLHKKIK
jgi:dGTPase